MAWDPRQYAKFGSDRLQPAIDLLSRVPLFEAHRVVDLGCGAGVAIPLLAARFPEAEILGVDSSKSMLERGRADFPKASFVRGDIAEWSPAAPVDLLYSNAALHWLGDHERLFAHCLDGVRPGGWLAVQMPKNFAEPSHVSIDRTLEDGPWRETLLPHRRSNPVASAAEYFRWLSPHASQVIVWETTYLQVLSGENPVAEYTKGSWLSQYLALLDEPMKSDFEAAYRARVVAAYPKESDGKTLFPFRRLFILAQRSS